MYKVKYFYCHYFYLLAFSNISGFEIKINLCPKAFNIFVFVFVYLFFTQQLREEIESAFYDGKFKFEDLRINDVVGLLKQFLRDLPTPILTLDYINAFAMVESKFYKLI